MIAKTKEERYTVDKVVEIISDYWIYKRSLQMFEDEMLPSEGVAQYGIESVMPRGNTVSSAVERTAINLTYMPKTYGQRVTDMKYLEDRWYRITEEQDAVVLQMRLRGDSTRQIAEMFNCSQRYIQQIIRRIAGVIVNGQAVAVTV